MHYLKACPEAPPGRELPKHSAEADASIEASCGGCTAQCEVLGTIFLQQILDCSISQRVVLERQRPGTPLSRHLLKVLLCGL